LVDFFQRHVWNLAATPTDAWGSFYHVTAGYQSNCQIMESESVWLERCQTVFSWDMSFLVSTTTHPHPYVCSLRTQTHTCARTKASHLVLHLSYRVYCLLGDGEMSEGSVWEAMSFASYYQLDNLVAIMDINRLGQSDPAPLQHHVEKYQKRCEAFG